MCFGLKASEAPSPGLALCVERSRIFIDADRLPSQTRPQQLEIPGVRTFRAVVQVLQSILAVLGGARVVFKQIDVEVRHAVRVGPGQTSQDLLFSVQEAHLLATAVLSPSGNNSRIDGKASMDGLQANLSIRNIKATLRGVHPLADGAAQATVPVAWAVLSTEAAGLEARASWPAAEGDGSVEANPGTSTTLPHLAGQPGASLPLPDRVSLALDLADVSAWVAAPEPMAGGSGAGEEEGDVGSRTSAARAAGLHASFDRVSGRLTTSRLARARGLQDTSRKELQWTWDSSIAIFRSVIRSNTTRSSGRGDNS